MRYPPTPAFAKAGAAPGTTGGVELGSRVASKGTRHHGNTSVSYMPQPSTCPCRLPGLKPSKLSAGLQGNNSYSYMPLPSVFQGVHDKFAWPQTLQTLPQASKATTRTATTCPCHLFFRGFKTAVCPASNPPNASNPPAGLQGNNSYSYYSYYMPLPSVFHGVQDCRLPGLKPPKRFQPSRRPPRQQLLQLHAPAIYFSRGSRLPFKATALTATTCPCHLFFRGFKTAVCPASNPPNASNPPAGLQGNNSYSYMPLPSVFQGVHDKFAWPQTLQTLPQASKATTLTATYMPLPSVFQGVQARPHTLQTLPQASKATTLTATCPCHLFFRGFKTAVCPASNPPNASNPSAGLKGNNSYSYTAIYTCPCHLFFRTFKTPCHLFFRGFKTAVCPASNPPNASNPPAGLQGNNSYSYMPLPSVFQGVQDCRLPGLKPPKRFQPSRKPPRQQLLQLHAPAIDSPQASKATTLTATCPCHLFFRGCTTSLPGLKPSKRFRRPPRQQLLQLYSYIHAPAICFSGGSRLPFARPQTPQTLPTLPQASKATTLTATTCPCHLKPPKRFQPSRRPPRQQLLQLLHAPAICFSGGSRLPFARPQTPQTLPTLPQASKATTLTATCPCHLFFKGFKTAV